MPEAPIDNQTLLKRTLVTMGAMVGACVVLVGALTLIASGVAGHVVAPAAADAKSPGPVASATVDARRGGSSASHPVTSARPIAPASPLKSK
jgi:hypothetical protein